MRRVAVFGNAGGGKSTLARRLAELTRLPLHSVDMMQFRTGGDVVLDEEYLKAHAQLLGQDEWIMHYSCLGAVRQIRHPGLCRSATRHARLVRDQTPDQRSVRGSGGLAEKQPAVEQHHEQLQGALALPSPADAEVQAAYRCRGGFEAGSPLEVTSRNGGVPRCSEARICECLIYAVRCIPADCLEVGDSQCTFAAIGGAADMRPHPRSVEDDPESTLAIRIAERRWFDR